MVQNGRVLQRFSFGFWFCDMLRVYVDHGKIFIGRVLQSFSFGFWLCDMLRVYIDHGQIFIGKIVSLQLRVLKSTVT